MTKQQDWLFRSLTSLIFIYGGIKHSSHPDSIFKRVASSTIYSYVHHEDAFKAAILLSGVLMIIGGLALMLGYKLRSAAIVLLSILVPITLITQLENLNDMGPFFKTVAISGSLIFIIKSKKNENKKHNISTVDPAY